jgi:hypothetical protein
MFHDGAVVSFKCFWYSVAHGYSLVVFCLLSAPQTCVTCLLAHECHLPVLPQVYSCTMDVAQEVLMDPTANLMDERQKLEEMMGQVWS